MKKQIWIILGILFLISLVSLSLVSAVTIKSVEVFPKEIVPSETATISISLENNHNEDVTDISIRLNLDDFPFAPYESSNEKTIEELSENEDEAVVFKVRALTDAESGIYKIPVDIIYYDEDGNKSEKKSLISLTVSSAPLLDIGVKDGLLLKGQNNEINVEIINKGLSDVKFLEIGVGLSTKYTILSQRKIYIGDISSDDFDTAEFKIYFKEDIPSIVNLPVTINYKDAVNNNYEQEDSLQLRVYSRKQAIELGLLQQSRTGSYITIIIILIIIWIIYRKIKKRKKKKKARAPA